MTLEFVHFIVCSVLLDNMQEILISRFSFYLTENVGPLWLESCSLYIYSSDCCEGAQRDTLVDLRVLVIRYTPTEGEWVSSCFDIGQNND